MSPTRKLSNTVQKQALRENLPDRACRNCRIHSAETNCGPVWAGFARGTPGSVDIHMLRDRHDNRPRSAQYRSISLHLRDFEF